MTDTPTDPNPDEPTGPDAPNGNDERSRKLKQAYRNAMSRLREDNRSEFDTLYSQEAQALGVEYTPRLSPEQKAAQELADLLEKFPALRDQFTQPNPPQPGPPA